MGGCLGAPTSRGRYVEILGLEGDEKEARHSGIDVPALRRRLVFPQCEYRNCDARFRLVTAVTVISLVGGGVISVAVLGSPVSPS